MLSLDKFPSNYILQQLYHKGADDYKIAFEVQASSKLYLVDFGKFVVVYEQARLRFSSSARVYKTLYCAL